MKKEKSLKKNMLLNAIRGILSVLFPLITFPYVSRVLGVESLGKYTFSASIISYIVLFAGLGITVYAVREGARLRDDRKKLSQFASEVFTINIWSMVISYLLLILVLIFVPHFKPYYSLLIILSLQALFNTVGIEWIYSIYEDYFFITIRAIVFQLLSLVCMFLFVKGSNDVIIYALITVLSSAGANLLNFFRAKKYCNIRFLWNANFTKHIKPIMILFATTLTVTIYVSSDTTILGFICSDYEVGIYGVSVKIYTILKTLLSSAIIVSIPRLSVYLGKHDVIEFERTSRSIYSTLLTFLLPAMIGLIMLSNEVVLLVSGKEYLTASASLMILAIAMFFCMGAYFWGQCILVTNKQENKLLFITIVSAMTNIVLNIFLIPFWKEQAAAFTTVIAEMIVYAYCMIKGRKYVRLDGLFVDIGKILIGCFSIILVILGVYNLRLNSYLFLFVSIALSLIVYLFIQLLLKNESIASVFTALKRKLFNRG